MYGGQIQFSPTISVSGTQDDVSQFIKTGETENIYVDVPQSLKTQGVAGFSPGKDTENLR